MLKKICDLFQKNKCAPLFLSFFLSLCTAKTAFGNLHISGTGNWATNHLGLETHTTQMGKASISVDLGSYFRIGYSYIKGLQHRQGYMDETPGADTHSYVYFEQDVVQTIHSVDLFAILYAGEILTPYVFAGAALKSFQIRLAKAGYAESQTAEGPSVSPTYGCGLAIALTRTFSLKIANTWSFGVEQTPAGEQSRARDSQLEVGLNYTIPM